MTVDTVPRLDSQASPSVGDAVSAALADLRETLADTAVARYPAIPAEDLMNAVDTAITSLSGARFPDYLPVLAERRVDALLRGVRRG